jgi:hypothetical protein
MLIDAFHIVLAERETAAANPRFGQRAGRWSNFLRAQQSNLFHEVDLGNHGDLVELMAGVPTPDEDDLLNFQEYVRQPPLPMARPPQRS